MIIIKPSLKKLTATKQFTSVADSSNLVGWMLSYLKTLSTLTGSDILITKTKTKMFNFSKTKTTMI